MYTGRCRDIVAAPPRYSCTIGKESINAVCVGNIITVQNKGNKNIVIEFLRQSAPL